MKKTVLVFGSLSALVSAGLMFATVPFLNGIGFDRGAYVGYTAIVISFLFVYFGVRSYRDNVQGGRLTFGRAFGIGILITLISCIGYVIAWEIIYYNFMPDFADKYAAYAIEHLRASGGTQAAMDAMKTEMVGMKAVLDNPFTNAAYSFIEPFPVGLFVTLISAAVLKKK